MQGPNPMLEKEMVVGASAVTIYRIVKKGASEDLVILSSAGLDKHLGVAQTGGASGARVRVAMSGIVKVEAGGTFVQGDRLTADASGRAIVAAPAAGTNVNIIGIAMSDSVVGDIGTVLLSPATWQG
jgi:hypothetical protein